MKTLSNTPIIGISITVLAPRMASVEYGVNFFRKKGKGERKRTRKERWN